MGKASDHSDDVQEDVITELLSKLSEGQSLRTICRDARMPSRETVWRWAKGDDELATAIARAREIGYEARAEQAIEDAKCADDAAKGRLAFDAERWYLSKINPARFGDKVTQEHTGRDGGDIVHKIIHEVVDPQDAG